MTTNDKIFITKDNLNIIIFSLIVEIVLLTAVYHQIYAEMFWDWMNDPNYSHGLLVPIVSFYLLWNDRHHLKKMEIIPSIAGVALFVLGIIMLLAGVLASELFTQRSSLIILLMGLIWSGFGFKWLKVTFFPMAFLFFMVPLPYILYDTIAFPLKLLATRIATEVLQFMNVMMISEGNIIYLQDITLEVADACSGIRSLMSLITLAVILAWFLQKGKLHKIILVFSAIPIAIMTNSFRVIITGLLADHYGSAVAEGFFHEFSGIIMFAVSFILLVGVSYLLNLTYQKKVTT